MYCFAILYVIFLLCAFYYALQEGGIFTMQQFIGSIIGAVIGASATILVGYFTNRKSDAELHNDVKETRSDIDKVNETLSKEIGSAKEKLSTEHNHLSENQNHLMAETRKVSDYINRQEGFVQAAAQRNVDLNNLLSQITALAKKVDDADSERKRILEERDRAIFERQKMEETLICIRQQNAELQSELRQTRADLRQANQIILQIQNGRNSISCDEQSFDPEL